MNIMIKTVLWFWNKVLSVKYLIVRKKGFLVITTQLDWF